MSRYLCNYEDGSGFNLATGCKEAHVGILVLCVRVEHDDGRFATVDLPLGFTGSVSGFQPGRISDVMTELDSNGVRPLYMTSPEIRRVLIPHRETHGRFRARLELYNR